MTEATFEQYLVQADAAVRKGDWAEAIRELEQAEQLQPTNTMVVTAIGSCLIQAGDVKRSIDYFERAASYLPDVFEAQNNLGVAYTLAGQYAQAEQAYRRALEIDAENLSAWKNLAQACLQQEDRVAEGAQILASIISAHPEDLDALMSMANLYEEAGELNSSETLYDQVLKIAPDLAEAVDGKARIAQVRSRQARIARPEHAKKLAALKGLASLKRAETRQELEPVGLFSPEYKNLVFFAAEQTQAFYLAGRLAAKLEKSGRKTSVCAGFDPAMLAGQDLAVFCDPIRSGDLVNGIKDCFQSQKLYAVVLEQDDFNLPADHPDYSKFGPGNPGAIKTLKVILQEAQFVIAASEVLAERYKNECKKIEARSLEIVSQNPSVNRSRGPQTKFNIGWRGTEADLPDLLLIKKALLAFMRSHSNAVFTVSGDQKVLNSFSAIDESRRLFMPMPEPEDTGYLLNQFDVLIVPLRKNMFNEARSGLPVLEAELSGTPWIASPIPAFQPYVKGTLAETMEAWGNALESYWKVKFR